MVNMYSKINNIDFVRNRNRRTLLSYTIILGYILYGVMDWMALLGFAFVLWSALGDVEFCPKGRYPYLYESGEDGQEVIYKTTRNNFMFLALSASLLFLSVARNSGVFDTFNDPPVEEVQNHSIIPDSITTKL